MAAANALAILVAQNATSNATFTAKNGNTTIGSIEVNGGWSSSGNTLTWTGNNPSITAGSTVSADGLTVSFTTPLSYAGVLANINHSAVPLDDGDTIVYTSIEINTTTDDLT